MRRLGERVVVMGECFVVDGEPDRYSTLHVHTRQESAHRYVYAETRGVVLRRDDVIHHLCEVKGCVRPDHLLATTAEDHGRLHAGTIGVEDAAMTPELAVQL